MENSFDKVQFILKQAESIAKEFSDNIDSLYLIGSSVFAPEKARDVDLVVFVNAPEALKKMITVKFLELAQTSGFKVDPVCVQSDTFNQPKNLFDPLFRSQLSLAHHGKLLWGREQACLRIDESLLWAYRWWCLYGDLLHLDEPQNSWVVQAQAKIITGEMSIKSAWSKQDMQHALGEGFKTLSCEQILEALLLTYDKFFSLSALNYNDYLYAPYWMKGLESYMEWIESHIGNNSGQPLLKLGLDYQYFSAYIVQKIVR